MRNTIELTTGNPGQSTYGYSHHVQQYDNKQKEYGSQKQHSYSNHKSSDKEMYEYIRGGLF